MILSQQPLSTFAGVDRRVHSATKKPTLTLSRPCQTSGTAGFEMDVVYRTRITVPGSSRVGNTAAHPSGRCGDVKSNNTFASCGAKFTHPWLLTRPNSRCQKAPCIATALLKNCTYGRWGGAIGRWGGAIGR